MVGNGPPGSAAPRRGIGGILLPTLENHAGRVALTCGDRSWSYRQLGRLVSAAMQVLVESGARKGERVAIVGGNDPIYVVAYFAIQCLGAVSVEIASHEPVDVVREILARTAARVVVTDRADLAEAVTGTMPVWSFTGLLRRIEGRAAGAPGVVAAAVGEADPASIVYTSGTTGLPKGVVLSHGNFCAVTEAILDYLYLGPEDRYALALPLYHSYGKSVLLTAVAVGASLVILNNFHDLPAFLSTLASEGCTVLSGVPYHANILLRRGDVRGHDLSRLRAVTFSGNHLRGDVIDGLRRILPEVRVYSMYGLTESTTRACYVPPERLSEKKTSCGRPIRCTRLRIVGEDGAVLPSGQVGRVELQGPNVMVGYWGEPELTAQTLVDGWLRTGDLGRVDEEGFLYLEGREKDIIKCAGERISPQEIEGVLASHPQVEEVAVIGVPDPMLGEAVKAFIVPRPGFDDVAALQTLCAGSLSHHKIPRHYEFVDSLPKTGSGKVQKLQLRGR